MPQKTPFKVVLFSFVTEWELLGKQRLVNASCFLQKRWRGVMIDRPDFGVSRVRFHARIHVRLFHDGLKHGLGMRTIGLVGHEVKAMVVECQDLLVVVDPQPQPVVQGVGV